MLHIKQNPHILPGQVACVHKGKIVWVGPLSAPWEDVECDSVIVSPGDYDQIKLRTLPDGRVIP